MNINKWNVRNIDEIILITRNAGILRYTPYNTLPVIVPSRVLKLAKEMYDDIRNSKGS